MKLTTGKYIVGGLWLVGFFALFIFIYIQTSTADGQVFAGKTKDAWEWLTPHIAPTIGIIIAVVLKEFAPVAAPPPAAADTPAPIPTVHWLLVLLCFIFSLAHISVLLLTLAAAGNSGSTAEAMAALQNANFPLGMLQGFVTTTLTPFFKKS